MGRCYVKGFVSTYNLYSTLVSLKSISKLLLKGDPAFFSLGSLLEFFLVIPLKLLWLPSNYLIEEWCTDISLLSIVDIDSFCENTATSGILWVYFTWVGRCLSSLPSSWERSCSRFLVTLMSDLGRRCSNRNSSIFRVCCGVSVISRIASGIYSAILVFTVFPIEGA